MLTKPMKKWFWGLLYVGVIGSLVYGLFQPPPHPGDIVPLQIPPAVTRVGSAILMIDQTLFSVSLEPHETLVWVQGQSVSTGKILWQYEIPLKNQAVYFLGFFGDEAIFATEPVSCGADSALPCQGRGGAFVYAPFVDCTRVPQWEGRGDVRVTADSLPPLKKGENRKTQRSSRDVNLTLLRLPLRPDQSPESTMQKTIYTLKDVYYKEIQHPAQPADKAITGFFHYYEGNLYVLQSPGARRYEVYENSQKIRNEHLATGALVKITADNVSQKLRQNTLVQLLGTKNGIFAWEPIRPTEKTQRLLWFPSDKAAARTVEDYKGMASPLRIQDDLYWLEGETLYRSKLDGSKKNLVQTLIMSDSEILAFFENAGHLYLLYSRKAPEADKQDKHKPYASVYLSCLHPERANMIGATTLLGSNYDFGDGEKRSIQLFPIWQSGSRFFVGGGNIYFETAVAKRGVFAAIEFKDSLHTVSEWRRIPLPVPTNTSSTQ